ncbi:MAG: methylated-DNA--[protein]-cysteine S-methyltransferase [Chitinophagaceae bacterium]|nr:methylated-DNA--[protein]-cysteine S-methyltransferase [Chitinophagaceae bacterium]
MVQLFTSYYDSPTGLVEIKGTEEAVFSILFIDVDVRVPSNSKAPDAVKKCLKQLDEYFTGKRKTFDFAMDQEGTLFQKKVWNELLNIPYGKTISYMELSRRIGDTKAIRAVGTTNGKNQLSIVVPCHRVIGSDGSLTGYGGGLWRKKWLLEHELKWSAGVQVLFPHDVKDSSS